LHIILVHIHAIIEQELGVRVNKLIITRKDDSIEIKTKEFIDKKNWRELMKSCLETASNGYRLEKIVVGLKRISLFQISSNFNFHDSMIILWMFIRQVI
jgi:hypothetical protein